VCCAAASVAIVTVLVFALACGPAAAQSLRQELQGLILSHPEVQARLKAVEAAREGVRQAYANYLPSLDVSGSVGYASVDSPLVQEAGGGEFTKDTDSASVRLTQKLFDGFATPSAVRIARLNEEVARFSAVGTRQNVLFDGINAYIEVLRQQRLVDLARDSERTIMRQLNLEDERVQRGAGIAVDVLQAKSRLQLAKERRVAFEGGLKDAIARYTQIFGHPPQPATMSLPPPPVSLLPDTPEQAIAIAEAENPAIDAALATVEAASERRRLARAGYYPTLAVVAGASRQRNPDIVQGTRSDLSVALQATWNLFNGFATRASVAQAAYDYRASQDNQEMVRRRVVEATRLAWDEFETARQRVDLLENGVAIASEVFEARQKLREAGRETAINVLDAENELYNARISLTIAQGDLTIAAFRVVQGMGRLDRGELALD
jgi:adhesin transport system outer membrane protein